MLYEGSNNFDGQYGWRCQQQAGIFLLMQAIWDEYVYVIVSKIIYFGQSQI